MLLNLAIRDVVLIDRLDLAFRDGLCVLTGETGAGKSILLDALGLALGMRAESGLVRAGAAQAVATAEFALGPDHPVKALLGEAGFDDVGERLVLRRVVGADGRSRAFIDDQPASVGLLSRIGERLVEIHGQFEQHGLLDQSTHRDTLDAYGGHRREASEVGEAWRRWREAMARHAEAEARLLAARGEEAMLRHARDEIAALAPKPGEVTQLAEERALRMNRERIAEALDATLNALQGEGAERALNTAGRQLERIRDKAGQRLDAAIAALERAAIETREASALVERAARELDRDSASLEAIEERLFALRALARKHGVGVDALADLGADITAKLALIEDGGDTILRLKRDENEAREKYLYWAEAVAVERKRAAKRLDQAVMRELPPLKLEAARFATVLTPLDEADWGPSGRERVHFEVATNKGAPAGPLAKIASGGELSRFMLALKLVLSKAMPVPTIVFDEVDSGVGGATAAAVGERLRRLASDMQILVVTHSPQVAAVGGSHWRVTKASKGKDTITTVELLGPQERREEIARMLAGSTVTPAARAAADSLMAGVRA